MKQEAVIDILKNEFKRKKARNPGYSLRAFAKHLKIDASNLSKILSQRKELGPKLRARLARELGIEIKDLDVLEARPQFESTRDENFSDHGLEVFQIVASWHHYAILELFKLKSFQGSPEEISRLLGLAKDEAKAALARLQRVGLLVSIKGRLFPKDETSSSVLGVATSQAHRAQQREILEKAIDALETIPIELRSQSSITIAIDSTKIDEAKELIKQFRRDLGRFLGSSENLDQVYHLSVSLYPVTDTQPSKRKKS